MQMQFKTENIKTIILASALDFGRCPLASKLPPALWPLADKPVVEHLLENISTQGIEQATICTNGNIHSFKDALKHFDSMDIKFLKEDFPEGTAGCIRDAADKNKDQTFLVFNACTVIPPQIDILMQMHRSGNSDLTVICNSSSNQADIFICDSSVLEYIPKLGYFDIKEGLIPALTRAGRKVYTASLPEPTGSFRRHFGYLNAAKIYLQKVHQKQIIAQTAKIHPTAVISGNVNVMDNADISAGAVIFGPSIIGNNVRIGKNSLVSSSVLWDGSYIGRNCQVNNCLIDRQAIVPSGSEVSDKVLTSANTRLSFNKAASIIADKIGSFKNICIDVLNQAVPAISSIRYQKELLVRLFSILILLAVFIWSYWPEIFELWSVWTSSDEYSSGIMVPFLVLYILWAKRKQISQIPVQQCLWGLVIFLCAQLIRYFGMFFMYSSAQRLSLVISLASIALLMFGWEIFKKIATVFIFLFLMLPLPRSVHNAAMLPLQNLATASAVFSLETIGYPVMQQGNVIYINNLGVAVAEACNGLRMITAFFVIVGLIVFLVKTQWWQKGVLLLSALPVAILCNTIRLTFTVIFFTSFNSSESVEFFHTFGGYLMMPLAIMIVVAELWIMKKLTQSPLQHEPKMVITNSRLA